ncbi:MAG: efflux RND transporter periplasmic adaptor subunit [Bacteroidales bacterium]
MSRKYIFYAVAILLMAISACKPSGNGNNENAENQAGIIELEAAQVKEAGIITAIPTVDTFFETFPVTATLQCPPTGKAYLQSPVSGWVDYIFVLPGQQVSKGSPVLRIVSTEAIDWQRDYAEAQAELRQARLDYERLKTLAESEITAQKDFQQARMRLQTLTARYKAARARLTLIEADTSQEASLSSSFLLRAPISGTLSALNVNLNTHVAPGNELGFIINTREVQLILHILPKDLSKIHIGQFVQFSLPGEDQKPLKARIAQITSTLDPENGGLKAIARIHNSSIPYFAENLTTEAQVMLNPSVLPSIPETAIIASDNKNYIYEVVSSENGKLKIRPREVHISSKSGSQIGISDTLGMIVISGTGQLPIP